MCAKLRQECGKNVDDRTPICALPVSASSKDTICKLCNLHAGAQCARVRDDASEREGSTPDARASDRSIETAIAVGEEYVVLGFCVNRAVVLPYSMFKDRR